jgi:hypothetical protein
MQWSHHHDQGYRYYHVQARPAYGRARCSRSRPGSQHRRQWARPCRGEPVRQRSDLRRHRPAHRAAIEFYTLQLDELDEDSPLQTLTRCDDTLWDVLTVEPTTMAGVVALLEYVGHHEFLNDDALGEDSLENTVLSAAFQAGGELEQAAQNFPPSLAETVRSILAHGRGGGIG